MHAPFLAQRLARPRGKVWTRNVVGMPDEWKARLMILLMLLAL